MPTAVEWNVQYDVSTFFLSLVAGYLGSLQASLKTLGPFARFLLFACLCKVFSSNC